MNTIPTPTVSEILGKEFMESLNISSYALAKCTNVPTSRIQDILHNRRKITIGSSIRLGGLFGISGYYFLSLQNDIDFHNTKLSNGNEYNKIQLLWLVHHIKLRQSIN